MATGVCIKYILKSGNNLSQCYLVPFLRLHGYHFQVFFTKTFAVCLCVCGSWCVYLLCQKMSTKHMTPFQLSHFLEYGLTIMVGRDVKKVVLFVQCNFCIYGGRSGDDVGRKHM